MFVERNFFGSPIMASVCSPTERAFQKPAGPYDRVDAKIGSTTNIYVFAFLLTLQHELPRLQELVRLGHRNISYPPKLRVYTARDTIFPFLEPDKLREQIELGKCRTHIHTPLAAALLF